MEPNQQYAMPFTEKGVLFWYTGFMVDGDGTKYTDLLAVNPDGKGDITGTNILWKKKDELSQNQMLTPVIKDGLIYTVNTRNILMCIDAATGEEIWSTHVTSNYNASPLYVNGNIWFFSVKGEVLVIKAGRKYEVSCSESDGFRDMGNTCSFKKFSDNENPKIFVQDRRGIGEA